MRTRASLASCSLGLLLLLAACGASSPAGDDVADDTPDARAGDVDAPGSPDAADPTDGPAGPDADPTPWVVPPAASCTPAADACVAPGAADPALFASYRKDAYLDDTVYREEGERPTTGGRIQIAGIAGVSGNVTQVLIDGVDPEVIYEPTESPSPTTVPFEWMHVWPRRLTAGEPVWVAFHSRDPAWDGKVTATLRIETAQGVAVDATFPVARTPAPITYVTTTAARDALIVHVANRDAAPHTATRLLVGGVDVLAAGIACLPEATLAPGATATWIVPLCEPATLGDAWTVVVDWADAPDAVGVGRVLPPTFPIETWNNTDECPFPGGDAAAAARLVDAGIDTIFVHGGTCNTCGCDTRQLLEGALPGSDLRALVTDDVLLDGEWTELSALAGVFTGDESDGEYYEDDGVPVPALKARKARRAWQRLPSLPVYNGGKTNKKVGAFAGMTDVQGMDLYVAACAPHITMFGNHPPLRGAYDYLRNTRENHMPLPTWLYAQGLHTGWNKETLLGAEVHVQPDPHEIAIQAMSVVAAGGKGFMWFQSNLGEADHAPARWQAMSDAAWTIRRVRERLRAGDPTGRVTVTGGPALAEAIRAPDALVVPVINLDATTAVDDIACGQVYLTGQAPHWRLGATTATVRIPVPADLGVLDVFEVTAGGVAEVPATVEGRDVVLTVALDEARAARLFVLARDGAARADAMTP